MPVQLEQIKQNALAALEGLQTEESLEQWRVAHLGRASPLMQTFNQLGKLSKEERPIVGQKANEVRQALEAALAERVEQLKLVSLRRSLQAERLDVTLPGRPLRRGRLHPATQTLRQIFAIFADMGFQVYRARDVELDQYNFQLLNFPPNHPAREMQDTFFIEAGERGDNPVLLRAHTSPGQIHAMREFAAENPDNPPPVRIILPGMCYRHEQITSRSEIQFNQVEGLAVGKN
ncbi:MAG: phenylalanine--tRNA ligase subunit alpha, partial [Anaerolineales bacterium]|nr:phenylalanine--tRNA ligase subunit alpha [Anaerolineales bacterium]